MKAMILNDINSLKENDAPLTLQEMPKPVPRENEVLIRVLACGVCHTEIDEIEGRTPPPNLPVIPGHQVVGIIEKTGDAVTKWSVGQRVGLAWIYSACGECELCRNNQENLCSDFIATGKDVDGGYAEYVKANEGFIYTIPEKLTNEEAVPLLCAGAIGYRSLRLTNLKNGMNLGLTGFGASAHLVLKMAQHLYPDTKIFVFARSNPELQFAQELGAYWTGKTEEKPPEKLHAIIDTTPAWSPVVNALACLTPGGRLVINAIQKEDTDKDVFAQLNYQEHIWMEKEIKSVANISRKDVQEFLDLSETLNIKPEIEIFELENANRALCEIKKKKVRGAKVLRVS
ncbi:MAG: zinc-dependent alcohol dehydrogenase family protein [Fibrobacterales bacterium]